MREMSNQKPSYAKKPKKKKKNKKNAAKPSMISALTSEPKGYA
jgi:hypothetical protein|tara:strand:+ start:1444 stop:1572 length:129 start_codon:yes stop_codon:yes gene_type:complete